jgi:hypothetical protein
MLSGFAPWDERPLVHGAMSGPPAESPADAPRSNSAQRRRVAFFFDDYIDTDSRILEIGPGDGWLGAYLIHAGFLALPPAPLGAAGRLRRRARAPGARSASNRRASRS